MSNPRRRRTAIVTITLSVILICQLPSVINFYALRGTNKAGDRTAALNKEVSTFTAESAKARRVDINEIKRGIEAINEKHRLAWKRADREIAERAKRFARIANLNVPVGWLPLGVASAAEGHVLPAVLGLLGMTLIGTASLARAYRATFRQYQGQTAAGQGPRTPSRAAPALHRRPRAVMLEARLPGLSEPVAAIALGGLHSVLRAPEAKIILLSPLLMIPIFGSILYQGRRRDVAELIRPLLASGGMLVIVFGMLQMMVNQFGFDRDGFRVFVLSAAQRRDILLGKNLAVVPLGAVLALVWLAIVEWFHPMRPDHLLAVFPQSLSLFLLTCIMTNWLSIIAPFRLPAGTMRASNFKLSTVLLQLVVILILLPLAQGLTLLPLLIEAIARVMDWMHGVPICLLLSFVECALVIVIYRLSLRWLGSLLQSREQTILEIVTSKA
jgi:hypothetical protein